ncbi:MAG TPA: hypothetical protein VH475_08065 [Tepidisphaeraceae bacterium]
MRITWDYDALSRLKQEQRDAGDDQNQAGDDYTAVYSYDLAGNRTSEAIDRAGTQNDETITYDYTDSLLNYNADDRLRTVTDVKGAGSTQVTTTTAYQYDPNGSTIEKTVSSTPNGGTTSITQHAKYVYDVRNRLVRLDAKGDTTYDASGMPLSAAADDVTYAYDDDGDRISETSGGQTTSDLVDKENPTGYSQVIEEKLGASTTPAVSYVIGNDVIGQVKQSVGAAPILQYLLYDGHGSTREVLGADGNPLLDQATNKYVFFDYDAFGNQVGFDMGAAATNRCTRASSTTASWASSTSGHVITTKISVGLRVSILSKEIRPILPRSTSLFTLKRIHSLN